MLIPVWIFGGVAIFIAIPYLIGKKGIEIYGNKKRYFSICLALILIFISIVAMSSSILDLVYRDFPEKTIKVTGINNPGLRSIMENEIVSEKEGIFKNSYHRFNFEIGRSYKIKYLKRTKKILEAVQLN